MRVEGNSHVKDGAPPLQGGQEVVHALLQLMCLPIDLFRVTLSCLSKLISCSQQLVCIGDGVLKATQQDTHEVTCRQHTKEPRTGERINKIPSDE